MYRVKEIFPAIQGEGHNVGVPMVFVRFAACNLRCNGEFVGGAYQPVCDTDFTGGRSMSAEDITLEVWGHGLPWVVLTGGEPLLQVDRELTAALDGKGLAVAVETNGTLPIPEGVRYVSVSPKTAEHTLKVERADELRYCVAEGQSLPKPRTKADHLFVSPAWQPDGSLRAADLQWCSDLCMRHPGWRLSVQTHKLLSMR